MAWFSNHTIFSLTSNCSVMVSCTPFSRSSSPRSHTVTARPVDRCILGNSWKAHLEPLIDALSQPRMHLQNLVKRWIVLVRCSGRFCTLGSSRPVPQCGWVAHTNQPFQEGSSRWKWQLGSRERERQLQANVPDIASVFHMLVNGNDQPLWDGLKLFLQVTQDLVPPSAT